MTCDELGICQNRFDCSTCTLRGLRIIQQTARAWAIPLSVPAMLPAAGDVDVARPQTSEGNAGGDRAIKLVPGNGRLEKLREPELGETPLSEAEVSFGLRKRIFTKRDSAEFVPLLEPVQIVRPAAQCKVAVSQQTWCGVAA